MTNGIETEVTKRNSAKKTQNFYGNGKLLISGEYFVLDGAIALALPTTFGQKLMVSHKPSFNPTLTWKSYDEKGKVWFESEYEFWHFRCLRENPSSKALKLQELLLEARKENSHFLRENVDVEVTTKTNFPLHWGLGSSSTHIFNIAQWAYVNPFKLLFETIGGSGYDIACAQAEGPIFYQLKEKMPSWSLIDFSPTFKENLYFVYLGMKKDSIQGVKEYRACGRASKDTINAVNALTKALAVSNDLHEFEELIVEHENFVSKYMGLEPIKKTIFSDFWGSIKSLGAWGGDFALVTSEESPAVTREYFKNKLGHDVIFSYKEIILERSPLLSKESSGQPTNSAEILL